MLQINSFDLLDTLGCRYAFYFQQRNQPAVFRANAERFRSASIIKLPVLLAWLHLERLGYLDRTELCRLDDEKQVQGAGFSWLLRARLIPYQDVLLMMMALSDNLCTNLVIRRIGLKRLQDVIHNALGLPGMEIQRKLMDYEARERGLDNWITAKDCIKCFDLVHSLEQQERAWVDSVLAVNQDDALLKRGIPRDTLTFCHKTGSITGVLHDWGYTEDCNIFLLTENVTDEPAVFEVFGALGRWMQAKPAGLQAMPG